MLGSSVSYRSNSTVRTRALALHLGSVRRGTHGEPGTFPSAADRSTRVTRFYPTAARSGPTTPAAPIPNVRRPNANGHHLLQSRLAELLRKSGTAQLGRFLSFQPHAIESCVDRTSHNIPDITFRVTATRSVTVWQCSVPLLPAQPQVAMETSVVTISKDLRGRRCAKVQRVA